MCPAGASQPPLDDLDAAWAELRRRQNQLKTDRTLADLALRLVHELGNGPAHRDVLREVAAAWHHDWQPMLRATSLLIEQAGRRGMDEPIVSEDGPAFWAADALSRCLESLTDTERDDPEVGGRLYAALANARRLCGPGRDAEAREAATRALELDGQRGEWWYDLGLLHKWRGRFADGLRANEKARSYLGPRRPVLWNLAICATALGKGELAREAWRQLGMPADLDEGSGMPFVAGLPPMLLRVLSRPSATHGTPTLPERAVAFELVWVAPISPCHGVLQSPTFRDAPIDYGDLVLWDGAPVASHETSDQGGAPVFPLLEVLRQGLERRWAFVALERERNALEGLEEGLPPGTRVFVQNERVEHHCPECEAGVPHEHGAATVSAAASGPAAVSGPATAPVSATVSAPVSASVAVSAGGLRRGKIIVPTDQNLMEFRDSWERAIGERPLAVALPSMYEQLGESKRAGQEDQAWRGIEAKALRRKAQP